MLRSERGNKVLFPVPPRVKMTPDRSGRLHPPLCGSMARHHAQVREGNQVLVPVPPRVKITSLIRGAAFTLLFVVLCSMARHYAQVREG